MRVETTVPLDNWRRSPRWRSAPRPPASTASCPPRSRTIPSSRSRSRRSRRSASSSAPRSPSRFRAARWSSPNLAGTSTARARGRFVLGLGTQVKGHNERRFSVPWTPPVPRMREYVEALRAIWRTWQTGEPLAYEGKHYRFTLMTPEFSPPQNEPAADPGDDRRGRPGDAAGRRPRVRRRASPRLRDAQDTSSRSRSRRSTRGPRAQGGRDRETFEIWGGGFIATGPDEAGVAEGDRGGALPRRVLRLDAQLPRRARARTAGTTSA